VTSADFPSTRAAALAYRARGFFPVPIPPREKGPRIAGWQELRLSEAEIPALFPQGWNGGILTGTPSANLIDLDLDCAQAVSLARAWAPFTGMVHGRPSRPASHRWYRATGAVGYHKFADPEPPGTTLLELRGDLHQTLAPPSIHPEGEQVAWETFEDPGTVEPRALLHAAQKIAAGALLCDRWSKTSHAGDPVGHNAGLALAGFFLRRWSLDETTEFLGTVADAAGANRRKVEADILDTARRIEAGRPATGGKHLGEFFSRKVVSAVCSWLGLADGSPPSRIATGDGAAPAESLENLTDLSNARLFVAQHKSDVRYDFDAKSWKIYDGRRWVRDPSGHVERLAKQTVESLFEIAAVEPEDRRTKIRSHALRSQDGRKIESLLKLARSEAEVAMTRAAFDTDPWLLNCQNGTIDLRIGKLRPHSRIDMLTKLAPVTFDPAATSPLWDSFLRRIMTPELAAFLQRAAGYSMTGDAREQKWFEAYGGGANGKSTFLRTLQAMMGDYAASTSMDTLVAKRGGGASNDIARLAGARFVTAVEAEEGQRLAEERIKQMTGGDLIAARFLYQEHFEFRPTFKLWIATNHRLNIRGTDHATWRRVTEIPFTVSIPENEQDRELVERLQAELSGILSWAVAGCLLWLAHGLQEPPAVREATADYRRQEDLIGAFLEDSCYLDPAVRTPSRDLYAAYQAWCVRTGEKNPLSQMKLAPKLRERGLTPDRDSTTGRKVWLGIGLEPLSEGT
jgi:P4 family phage/plasmid primase-like protien